MHGHILNISGIYFITDRTFCGLPAHEMTRLVLEAGVRIVQYREKNATRREIYEQALKLREMTSGYNAMLIVNDYADIALAVDADGVHLGQDDLPLREARRIMGERIVGISTHSMAEAKAASADGADYIGFGPIFHTTTKDAGPPQGLDNLRSIKQNVRVPVVAIGGISEETLAAVLEAGADAAAVATAICRGDVGENARRMMRIVKAHGLV